MTTSRQAGRQAGTTTIIECGEGGKPYKTIIIIIMLLYNV